MSREIEQLDYDTFGKITLGGSADTYTVTSARSINGYFQGLWIKAKVNATNTGATTLNVNDLGAKSCIKPDGSALTAGDLTADGIYDFVYNGTNFVVLAPSEAKTGSDNIVVTGTAGADGNLASWNADGDVVDSGSAPSDFAAASHGHTLSDITDSGALAGKDTVGTGDLADIATQRVLGRNTAGTGDPEEVTASQVLDWLGTSVEGDILYRGASSWQFLAKGNDDQVLTLVSGVPSWEDVSVQKSVVKAKSTSTNNMNVTSFTAIGFDVGDISVGSNISHDTSTNNTRFTVSSDGVYRATFNARGNSSSARAAPSFVVRVNGTTELDDDVASHTYVRAGSGHNHSSANLTVIMELNNGDYVEVGGFRQDGNSGTWSLTGNTTFTLERV